MSRGERWLDDLDVGAEVDPAPTAAQPAQPTADVPRSALAPAAVGAILYDPDASQDNQHKAARAVLELVGDPTNPYSGDLVERAQAVEREILTPGSPASVATIISAARAAVAEPPGELEPQTRLMDIVTRMTAKQEGRTVKAALLALIRAGVERSLSWWTGVFARMDEGRRELDAATKHEAASDGSPENARDENEGQSQ